MTNQKPVQGGATEEQIEAAARAIYELERAGSAMGGHWPTWDSLAEKSDRIEADLRREYARAALSASASAHPADERHDAEERQAESEELRDAIDHIRGAVDFQDSINPEAVKVLIDAVILERPGAQDPKTGELVAEAREWAKYDATGASKIVIALCDALSNQAESENHAATATGDRENLITDLARVAGPLEEYEFEDHASEAAGLMNAAVDALAAPVEVDETKLAERLYSFSPDIQPWNGDPFGFEEQRGEGRVKAEKQAHAVAEWLRGEGR